MKAMSMEDLEKVVEELRKKRPKWMYKRALVEFEAWLEYYKAVEKRNKKVLEEQEAALLVIHAKICKILSEPILEPFYPFMLSLEKGELELLREKLPDLLKVNQ